MKQTTKTSNDQGDARINQEAIGQGLRRLFDDVVNEAVPDEFLELLKRADDRATGDDVDLEKGA